MRNPRLYCPEVTASGTEITLAEKTSHYVGNVLRMSKGQALRLFNGSGGYFDAVIVEQTKKKVTVSIGQHHDTETESPLPVHLGIALSKGDKMDWIVQKATELGVTSITPLRSQRSDVKIPKERQLKRIEHWQQVAISACEQCERNRIPTIHDISNLDEWTQEQTASLKLVLHHRADEIGTQNIPESVALLIGPEGGLTAEEIKTAEDSGFKSLCLGQRVMRTETAPVAALSVLQLLWGDFNLR